LGDDAGRYGWFGGCVMSLTINHQTNDISIAGGGSPTLGGAAAGGGAYEFIASQSATSFVSSISFTGLSMTDYSALKIIGRGIQYNTNPSIYVRLIDDTGSDITSLTYNSQCLDALGGNFTARFTTGGRDEWFGCGNGVITGGK
jgi:hypothetical protein